jgi:hypothetical protein
MAKNKISFTLHNGRCLRFSNEKDYIANIWLLSELFSNIQEAAEGA